MLKHARHLVSSGALGTLRKVISEYAQGWLTRSGAAITTSTGVSSLADVGSHAHHTIRYVTGLEVEELVADVSTFVGGIREPDDANILLKFKGGVHGMMVASQSSTGEENDMRIRVYGDKGMLEWHQEHPNELKLAIRDQPVQILTRGKGYLSDIAKKNERLPAGHPEGYIEAFANIYINVANVIREILRGKETDILGDFPTVSDACFWSDFESKALESCNKKVWIKVDYKLPEIK